MRQATPCHAHRPMQLTRHCCGVLDGSMQGTRVLCTSAAVALVKRLPRPAHLFASRPCRALLRGSGSAHQHRGAGHRAGHRAGCFCRCLKGSVWETRSSCCLDTDRCGRSCHSAFETAAHGKRAGFDAGWFRRRHRCGHGPTRGIAEQLLFSTLILPPTPGHTFKPQMHFSAWAAGAAQRRCLEPRPMQHEPALRECPRN